MINAYHQNFRRVAFVHNNQETLERVLGEISSEVSSKLSSKLSSNLDTLLVVDSTNQPPAILPPSNLSVDKVIFSSQVNQYLGGELGCLIYDARENFNPNNFSAIVGNLIGGGLLILHLPDKVKTTSFKSATLTRLVERLSKLSSNILVNISNNEKRQATAIHSTSLEAVPPLLLEEQNSIISQIERCAAGHARRPLVITANRGRGKSAALGISAAKLIFEKHKLILITAPRRSNLDIFFQFFEQELSRLNKQKGIPYSSKQVNDGQPLLNFIPIDKLVQSRPSADLVMVDEAGAIPVQMLEKIAINYNRIIFSTTIDGYEGNGQGFKIRFKSRLNKIYPQSRFASLEQPIRWPLGDPLEIAINDALLFSFEKKEIHQLKLFSNDQLSIQSISKEALKNDEPLLKSIYQLLVTAHYQTRPSDLERMLNDPSILIFVALFNNQVLATALVAVEGQLSDSNCSAIESGRKRMPGHLIPQAIMAFQGNIEAGKLAYWRIMRIAVQPLVQNRNIGSKLLAFLYKQASEHNVDMLATSFALTEELARFWYRNNFSCSRLALSKDSSTGDYPGEFLKLTESNSPAARQCFENLRFRFNGSFFHCCSSSYIDVNNSVLTTIIEQQIEFNREDSVVEYRKEIERYLIKARSFEMVEWPIFNFVAKALSEGNSQSSIAEKALLVGKVFKKESWKHCSKEFDFKGIKQCKEAVREAIGALFQANDAH